MENYIVIGSTNQILECKVFQCFSVSLVPEVVSFKHFFIDLLVGASTIKLESFFFDLIWIFDISSTCTSFSIMKSCIVFVFNFSKKLQGYQIKPIEIPVSKVVWLLYSRTRNFIFWRLSSHLQTQQSLIC